MLDRLLKLLCNDCKEWQYANELFTDKIHAHVANIQSVTSELIFFFALFVTFQSIGQSTAWQHDTSIGKRRKKKVWSLWANYHIHQLLTTQLIIPDMASGGNEAWSTTSSYDVFVTVFTGSTFWMVNLFKMLSLQTSAKTIFYVGYMILI